MIGITVLLIQPEPVDYCPCFEDTACFTGIACGLMIGHARMPSFQNFDPINVQLSLIRYAISNHFINMRIFVSDFNEIPPSKLLRTNIKVKEKFCVVLVHSFDKTAHISLNIKCSLHKGIFGLLGTRFVMKPILFKVLPVIFETFKPPTRRFLKHLPPSEKMSKSVMKPIPSITNVNKATGVPYDIEIASKFICYCAMGWVVSEPVPISFLIFKLQ
jgi:hypothetical protein